MEANTVVLQQLYYHQDINLLCSRQENGYRLAGGTRALVRDIRSGSFSPEEEHMLLQDTTRSSLSSFYRVNQYYHFGSEAEKALLRVYGQLLEDIKREAAPDFEALADRHYSRLQGWFSACQPAARLTYSSAPPRIGEPVVCASYRAATQVAVLGIDCGQLKEPILDIGCGRAALLVHYLREMGLDAYGMDREAEPGKKVSRSCWLAYPFKAGTWGTIISHLGFTNHFHHHHLKAGTEHLLYAKQYVQILGSLRTGGRFYYAPGVPFIERFLDPGDFRLMKRRVTDTSFYATVIERL